MAFALSVCGFTPNFGMAESLLGRREAIGKGRAVSQIPEGLDVFIRQQVKYE